jgi:hypothetical protein
VNSDEKVELPKEDSIGKTSVLNVVGAAKIEESLTKTNEEGEEVAEEVAVEVAENEEVVEYSVDDLQGMSLKELQALAKDSDIDFKGLSKAELIEIIIEEFGTTEEVEEIFLSEDEEVTEEEEVFEAEEIDGEMSLEEALALLGEDSETEDDFSDIEFEEVEVEVQEGDVSVELDDNNSGSN